MDRHYTFFQKILFLKSWVNSIDYISIIALHFWLEHVACNSLNLPKYFVNKFFVLFLQHIGSCGHSAMIKFKWELSFGEYFSQNKAKHSDTTHLFPLNFPHSLLYLPHSAQQALKHHSSHIIDVLATITGKGFILTSCLLVLFYLILFWQVLGLYFRAVFGRPRWEQPRGIPHGERRREIYEKETRVGEATLEKENMLPKLTEISLMWPNTSCCVFRYNIEPLNWKKQPWMWTSHLSEVIHIKF